MENAVEEDVGQLLEAMEDERFKSTIIEKVGQEEYDKKLKVMKDLKK